MRRPLPAALVVILWGLAACSGANEYANPRPDPAPPLPSASALAAVVEAPACHPEGEDFTPADAGSACCEGLTRAPLYKGAVIRLDECEAVGDGRYRCVRCGDGRCGLGENTCNCPRDCHWP